MASVTAPASSRVDRVRNALTLREWFSLSGMAVFVMMLHVMGWGVMLVIVAPKHFQVSATQVFGVGLGLTAYTLGMRHAFDADHIAAIDNTTRKLIPERAPEAVKDLVFDAVADALTQLTGRRLPATRP
jgi:high-affinity nickel-transport protein